VDSSIGGAPSSAALAAWAELEGAPPRPAAAYLPECDGEPVTAALLYAEAARNAPNLPERDHLTRQAARINAQAAQLRSMSSPNRQDRSTHP
jgi:hypothetical protein